MTTTEPGLETYSLNLGEITALRLDCGDRLTVIDHAGCRPVELTVIADTGIGDDVLGISSDGPATALRSLAAAKPDDGADEVLALLAARGVDPHRVNAARLFGEQSSSGARRSFTAQLPALIVIAAPAALLLEVRRAVPARSRITTYL